MIKNLPYRSFKVQDDKVKIGRNISSLEAKVDVDEKNAHIIVALRDGQDEIGRGYFNTFPSKRNMKEIRDSYYKLVYQIENGRYEIVRNDGGNISMNFPEFWDDYNEHVHGRFLKVAIMHNNIRLDDLIENDRYTQTPQRYIPNYKHFIYVASGFAGMLGGAFLGAYLTDANPGGIMLGVVCGTIFGRKLPGVISQDYRIIHQEAVELDEHMPID